MHHNLTPLGCSESRSEMKDATRASTFFYVHYGIACRRFPLALSPSISRQQRGKERCFLSIQSRPDLNRILYLTMQAFPKASRMICLLLHRPVHPSIQPSIHPSMQPSVNPSIVSSTSPAPQPQLWMASAECAKRKQLVAIIWQ